MALLQLDKRLKYASYSMFEICGNVVGEIGSKCGLENGGSTRDN